MTELPKWTEPGIGFNFRPDGSSDNKPTFKGVVLAGTGERIPSEAEIAEKVVVFHGVQRASEALAKQSESIQ